MLDCVGSSLCVAGVVLGLSASSCAGLVVVFLVLHLLVVSIGAGVYWCAFSAGILWCLGAGCLQCESSILDQIRSSQQGKKRAAAFQAPGLTHQNLLAQCSLRPIGLSLLKLPPVDGLGTTCWSAEHTEPPKWTGHKQSKRINFVWPSSVVKPTTAPWVPP